MPVFDGDHQGREYKKAIELRSSKPEYVEERCLTHQQGVLESELLAGDLKDDIVKVVEKLEGTRAYEGGEHILKWLRKYKTRYPVELAARMRDSKSMAEHGPRAFRIAIEKLQTLE